MKTKTAKKKAVKSGTVKAKGSLDKKKKILINFVLDKSGSMGSILDDTIGGFNIYINKLKEDDKVDYRFSLTLFDTTYHTPHVGAKLADVPELNKKTYVPNGGTALYDAIGIAVKKTEDSVADDEGVLTVIMTDGQNNSSREYTLDAVKKLIERKEKDSNWTFVFLGVGLDTYAVGDSMGIQRSNSVSYNAQNMRATFVNTAAATVGYAHAQGSIQGQSLRSDFYDSVAQCDLNASGMTRRAGGGGAGIKPKAIDITIPTQTVDIDWNNLQPMQKVPADYDLLGNLSVTNVIKDSENK